MSGRVLALLLTLPLLTACPPAELPSPATVWTPPLEPHRPWVMRDEARVAALQADPEWRTRRWDPQHPDLDAHIIRAHLLYLEGAYQDCHRLIEPLDGYSFAGGWGADMQAAHCLLARANQEQRPVIELITDPDHVLTVETALRERDWAEGDERRAAMREVAQLLRTARARWPLYWCWTRWARDEAQILALLKDDEGTVELMFSFLQHVQPDGAWVQNQDHRITELDQVDYLSRVLMNGTTQLFDRARQRTAERIAHERRLGPSASHQAAEREAWTLSADTHIALRAQLERRWAPFDERMFESLAQLGRWDEAVELGLELRRREGDTRGQEILTDVVRQLVRERGAFPLLERIAREDRALWRAVCDDRSTWAWPGCGG